MSFLENSVLEKHYVEGEKLFDDGAVLEVVEVEKNLWSVMVRDNGILEVEIQNPNTKRQKSTCECAMFRTEKSCAHIAAALLHLRKKESERVEKRKEATIRKQTFNLKTILNHIEAEDLIKFVKSYAQTDRMFGVLLKASFARKIDLADNSQKYDSILSSLIKPISTEQNASSTGEIRIGLKVIEEFHSQLEDALSLNQLEEAFLIVRSCLPKLHYLYSNYSKRTDKVTGLLSNFHGHIDTLYENQLAPALLDRLDALVIELFQKSYYNHLDFLTNIFHIAEKHERNGVVEELREVIQHTSNVKVKKINFVVFTALLIQNGYYDKVQASDDTIIAAIRYLIKMKRGAEAIEFMELYRANQSRNRKLEYTLASTYQSLGMLKKFYELGAELYVSNDDIRYYRMLKENSTSKSWESIKELILKNIELQEPNSSFIARFYDQEGMITELIELLEDESDLRHIMKYDYSLYKTNYIDIERIYHKAIKGYLDNHAGHIATRFIDEILHHLNQIRAHKLVTSIKNFITTHFPYRNLLMTFS
ncbi:MAG: hypothetical protein AAGA77_10305 [Bacteroidota bacterium]